MQVAVNELRRAVRRREFLREKTARRQPRHADHCRERVVVSEPLFPAVEQEGDAPCQRRKVGRFVYRNLEGLKQLGHRLERRRGAGQPQRLIGRQRFQQQHADAGGVVEHARNAARTYPAVEGAVFKDRQLRFRSEFEEDARTAAAANSREHDGGLAMPDWSPEVEVPAGPA